MTDEMQSGRFLVVGIGNEHRGDDAAGLLAVRALRTLPQDAGDAEIVEHHGEGTSLLDLWAGHSRVILVDAVRAAGPAGQVIWLDGIREQIKDGRLRASTHVFGPAGAIEMARCLGRLPREVEIYGITANEFAIGAEAQPAVCRAARAVAESIAEKIRGRRNHSPGFA